VFEDIDVAMVNSAKVLNRDDESSTEEIKEKKRGDSNRNKTDRGAAAGSSITLSGLLNAIVSTSSPMHTEISQRFVNRMELPDPKGEFVSIPRQMRPYINTVCLFSQYS
jgi:hypothetical protein